MFMNSKKNNYQLSIIDYRFAFALLIAFALSTKANAQYYRVDSVVSVRQENRYPNKTLINTKYVFSYDSLLHISKAEAFYRYIESKYDPDPEDEEDYDDSEEEDDEENEVDEYNFDEDVPDYENTGEWGNRGALYLQYNANGKVIRAVPDDNGQIVVKEYDNNGYQTVGYSMPQDKPRDYEEFWKYDLLHDNDGKLLSETYSKREGEGDWKLVWRKDNVFDSEGVLTGRIHMIPQTSKKWVNGKIVDTGNNWQEIGRDICDRNGNIIEHKDFDNERLYRFTYDEDNRLVEYSSFYPRYDSVHASKRIFDKICEKTEITYDRHGNLIHVDRYSPSSSSSKIYTHDATAIATYNLEVDADEVAGLKFIFEEGWIDSDVRKYFKADDIWYDYKFKNAPIYLRVQKPSIEDEENRSEFTEIRIYIGER